jgi:hypothetical protein
LILGSDGITRKASTETTIPRSQFPVCLSSGYHEDRTPTHGYEATREAAGRIRQELAQGVAVPAGVLSKK